MRWGKAPVLLLPFFGLSVGLQIPVDRRSLFRSAAAATTALIAPPVFAFEGGVGGLGKTKPQTGVILREEGSVPIQNNQGIISAEILSSNSNPILVQFQTPYPLLSSTSGLEARDLQQPESAFVQVISGISPGTNGKALYNALTENILGSRGKYGAYGSPVDVKIKKTQVDNLYKASFTTYTPAMRESERIIFLNCKFCGDNTLVVLVTGTTLTRFKTQEKVLEKIAESFVAIDAPKSDLSGR